MCKKGELTILINDQQVTFNVLDTVKSPDDVEYCNFISVVDFAIAERLNNYHSKEEVKAVTFEEFKDEDLEAARHIIVRGEATFKS